MNKIIITISVLGIAAVSTATVINIPADYPTIQQGIDASADGDTVLVQQGTYVENINFNGHNIVLGSLFLTTGDTSYVSQTIIDGGASGSVLTLISGEDSTTVITGFTVKNGFGTGTQNNGYGGGFTCKDNSNPIITGNNITYNRAWQGAGINISYSAPAIINNLFFADTSDHDGGAIACFDANPLIDGNIFLDNLGDCGAAVFCGDSRPTITNNVIIGNWATNTGGGIGCRYGSYPVIRNNTIIGNRAQVGGGIGCLVGGAVISNNLIKSNRAYAGGGIYSHSTSSITIINNTITNNVAYGNPMLGGGLYCDNSNVSIENTILWADSAEYQYNEIYSIRCYLTVSFSNIENGWSGVGNIDIDPLFRDPAGGDFHLMSIACGDSADSPCIDAGDPDILDSLLDCSWGLGGTRSDMGAYGGGDSVTVGIFDNIPSLPDRFMLLQNYPNPFNARTTFRFVLPKSQNVKLTVYDLLGRQVENPINNFKQAGVHTITFDASHLSSGVYFYRLQAGEMVKIKRMVLLK
jgi:parallel beta-helix repeat protein